MSMEREIRLKTSEIVDRIRKAINEDHEISYNACISVKARKGGLLEGDEIRLTGMVVKAAEKERALNIARRNSVEELEVIDELIIAEKSL
jgi:hypothetical protein